MTITKVDESYTRFVDAYDQLLNDKNEIDWNLELKRWIAAANFCSSSISYLILDLYSSIRLSIIESFSSKPCLGILKYSVKDSSIMLSPFRGGEKEGFSYEASIV